MDNLKITAIFRGCAQVGENHYVDYAKTRNIPMTDWMIMMEKRNAINGFI